ncbi:MAG TPA: hypothetical protein VMN79_18090 [Casimicrobiaceae bacterium]|nr:hypothetical protein [Casimicrobiaceae bacterium]
MVRCTLRARAAVAAVALGALFRLAGGAAAQDAEAIAAPQLAVGDHWQYRLVDNLRRGAVSQLDVEVTAVSGGVARIRVARSGAAGQAEWIDEVEGGTLRSGSLYGEPVRPFNPPVQLLAFPLSKGKTWKETINTLRKDTGIKDQILIYGKVGAAAAVTVPAGRFDTVFVYRTVNYDDVEFWRSRTFRTDSVWYAAAAKGPVREKHEAKYNQNDRSLPEVRTESTVLELVSFRPGN